MTKRSANVNDSGTGSKKIESSDIFTGRGSKTNNSRINKKRFTFNGLTIKCIEWEWMDR
jgi:hypothetical protein